VNVVGVVGRVSNDNNLRVLKGNGKKTPKLTQQIADLTQSTYLYNTTERSSSSTHHLLSSLHNTKPVLEN
jgi:hypothetical protein